MSQYVLPEFIKEYPLANEDLSSSGQPSMTALFKMVGNASLEQCRSYDFSEENLLERNQTWMLSILKFEFSPMPTNLNSLELHTWPTGMKGLYSCRDTELVDKNNNSIVRVTSAWIIADFIKRHPCRLPDSMVDFHPPGEVKRVLIDDLKRLKIDFKNKVIASKRCIPEASDIDFNNHVTASVYLKWSVESLDESFLKRHQILESKACFQNEIRPGQEVQSQSFVDIEDGIIYSYHQIIYINPLSKEVTINFYMKIKWEEK